MRTVVMDRDVVEVEVKPQGLIEEYRRLLDEDVRTRLQDGLGICHCPGCQSTDAEQAFVRSGLQYLHCNTCSTLYVSPRPSEKALDAFYRDAPSAIFWQEKVLPSTKEARREKLYRPRVQWLLDVVDEYRSDARSCVAVGYHNRLLVEELLAQAAEPFAISVSNPSADIEFADGEFLGVTVCPTAISELDTLAPVDLLLAFDIVDRCFDPDALFRSARGILEPGGLLLATTTLGSGFDIQMLWEAAENIHPPERLNLLSVEGLTQLCKRHGFEILEFSTPGMFDVETVRHAIAAQPDGDWPRFIRYLVDKRDNEALEALQEYLQRFRLSSFGRIALKKTM
jgi:hypothetical protein